MEKIANRPEKEEKDPTKIVIIYVSILKSRALWKTETEKEVCSIYSTSNVKSSCQK